MTRAVTALLLALIVLVLLAGPASSAMEKKFIFFPDRELLATPSARGLAFEDVHFESTDGTPLHGWLLSGTPDAPLVLFCHGNAGNISHRIDNLAELQRRGFSVFIFDYRGYGLSGGNPSEEGTYGDARGALAWLRRRGWSPARMIYFGRSLGAAVALQLALEEPPGALVLESPFTSVRAMGWRHNPVLTFILGWLLNARYDNAAKIVKNEAPLLIIHGKDDRIVPVSMAHKLFDLAHPPKSLHLIPGAGHNDTLQRGGEDYWRLWLSFTAKHFPQEAP